MASTSAPLTTLRSTKYPVYFVWLLLLTLSAGQGFGQSRSKLLPGRELAITGGGMGTLGVGLLLARRNVQRPAPEIDLARVPRMDRWVAHQWHPHAHRTSNALFLGAVVASFTGGIIAQEGDRPWEPAVITGESLLLSAGLTTLVKELVRRPRPYLYDPAINGGHRSSREDFVSFWSGHTANTAAMTICTAMLVQRTDVPDGVKAGAWAGAIAAPLLMGWLRVRAGRHFVTDVIAGAVAGTATGLIVPMLHHERNPTH